MGGNGGRNPGGTGRRILMVSDERGWPRRSGYRRRTAQIAAALATVGRTDWVVAPRNPSDDGSQVEIPDDLSGSLRANLVPAPTRPPAVTAARWLTSRRPWPLAAGDWRAAERMLRARSAHRLDVIWAMGLDALAATERAGLSAPVVVVDADLESLKLARRLATDAEFRGLRRMIAQFDVERWARLERDAATRLAGFSVCSEDERLTLGGTAFVTANSYEAVPARSWADAAPGRRRGGLLFVGSLSYEPNVDGLAWFVDRVMPLVLGHRPEATLRVVGAGLPADHRLRDVDAVHILDGVDELAEELVTARAMVVPLRWGAGTRIKILEAFAHRVPVAATTLGAEGLDVASGEHLLIADEAAALAEACQRLLDHGPEAGAMVAQAERLFRERYEESVVRHRLAATVESLIEAAVSDRR